MAESVLSNELPSLGQDNEPAVAANGDWEPDRWWNVTRGMMQGDQEAFRDYYDHFFEIMFAESRRCAGCDEQSCLDIVHDAMLKAIRGMKPITNHRSLTAWTRSLVRSVTYDWLRGERRRQRTAADASSHENNRSTEVRDDFLRTEARLLWLEEQIGQMPDDLRRMFRWRYRWGWTLRRIGQQLGLKPGAVDGRLRRAIDELRTLAEEQCDD